MQTGPQRAGEARMMERVEPRALTARAAVSPAARNGPLYLNSLKRSLASHLVAVTSGRFKERRRANKRLGHFGRLLLGSALLLTIQACDFDNVGADWKRVRPGGATACALGGEYEFYVRAKAPDALLVFLDGGGGCWSRETCEPDEVAQYTSRIEAERRPDVRRGILDVQHPLNPMSSFSMVFVPYCTADAHLGTRVHTYESSRAGEPLVIRHVGHINAAAAVEWIETNFGDPTTIVVAGLSAGGVATPFYADVLARRYPQSRVIAIADGVGAWGAGTLPGIDPARWGISDAFAGRPGWSDLEPASFGVDEFFRTAAAVPGEPAMFQIDFAFDQRQALRLEQSGGAKPDVRRLLEENRAYIQARDPDFRSFTLGGNFHGALLHPSFYHFQEGDVKAVNWLTNVLTGAAVTDARCSECERPHLTYAPSDLELLDRTLTLLDRESAWDPDPPQSSTCRESDTRRSIWCALVEATRQLKLGDPMVQAGIFEVVILATERLGHRDIDRPLGSFNNAEDRTFEDVRSLLEQARSNIARALASDP